MCELALAGGVTEVCELLWEGVFETELVAMLLAKAVDDAKAVDELAPEVL